MLWSFWYLGFFGGSESKESSCDAGDLGWIPGSVRSSREENGNPLQHSCLEKSLVQRSLAGYTPWGCKQLDLQDMTELLTLSLFTSGIWMFAVVISDIQPSPVNFDYMDFMLKNIIWKTVVFLIYWSVFKFCAWKINMNLYGHWKQRTFICVLDFANFSISLFFCFIDKDYSLIQYISINFTS